MNKELNSNQLDLIFYCKIIFYFIITLFCLFSYYLIYLMSLNELFFTTIFVVEKGDKEIHYSSSQILDAHLNHWWASYLLPASSLLLLIYPIILLIIRSKNKFNYVGKMYICIVITILYNLFEAYWYVINIQSTEEFAMSTYCRGYNENYCSIDLYNDINPTVSLIFGGLLVLFFYFLDRLAYKIYKKFKERVGEINGAYPIK